MSWFLPQQGEEKEAEEALALLRSFWFLFLVHGISFLRAYRGLVPFEPSLR